MDVTRARVCVRSFRLCRRVASVLLKLEAPNARPIPKGGGTEHIEETTVGEV